MLKIITKKSLIIDTGQLITVDKPPTKQQYNRGQSNFWFDKQNNSIRFRAGQKKDKSIQVEFQNEKYQYEGIISSNIYEIIVRTSIFSLLFGNSSRHVAVTEESLRLPFEQQPWFIGAVDKKDIKKLEQGTSSVIRRIRDLTQTQLRHACFSRVQKDPKSIFIGREQNQRRTQKVQYFLSQMTCLSYCLAVNSSLQGTTGEWSSIAMKFCSVAESWKTTWKELKSC